jgi:hypothetical protein
MVRCRKSHRQALIRSFLIVCFAFMGNEKSNASTYFFIPSRGAEITGNISTPLSINVVWTLSVYNTGRPIAVGGGDMVQESVVSSDLSGVPLDGITFSSTVASTCDPLPPGSCTYHYAPVEMDSLTISDAARYLDTTGQPGCGPCYLIENTAVYVELPDGLGILGEQGLTPLPAALPLFATGLGVMGLLGWRRKRKPRVPSHDQAVSFGFLNP